MKSVLVTGATTPLGVGLVEYLLADPKVERILAVGIEAQWPFAKPSDGRLRYLQVDLTRDRHLHDLLYGPACEARVDSVLHMALHRNATAQGARVHALNVDSTRALLGWAERHPTIKRFVFRGHAEAYDIQAHRPAMIAEDHPLNLSPRAPQWLRDRIEADLTVCTRMGLTHLNIMVLRCAECLCEGIGSQFYDYLNASVCFRPLGFDPMLNLLSRADLLRALSLALGCDAQGVFNIPGADTLPLSRVVELWDRRSVPVPSSMLKPLYRLRNAAGHGQFRYDLNHWRFHFNGVLDGQRAAQVLGYYPQIGIDWPAGGQRANVPRVTPIRIDRNLSATALRVPPHLRHKADGSATEPAPQRKKAGRTKDRRTPHATQSQVEGIL